MGESFVGNGARLVHPWFEFVVVLAKRAAIAGVAESGRSHLGGCGDGEWASAARARLCGATIADFDHRTIGFSVGPRGDSGRETVGPSGGVSVGVYDFCDSDQRA